jgi:hypothetical protein
MPFLAFEKRVVTGEVLKINLIFIGCVWREGREGG